MNFISLRIIAALKKYQPPVMKLKEHSAVVVSIVASQ